MDGPTLSYAETEALVRAVHDIGEGGERALLARFKYLQRMDFPHRPKVGRGSRVGYGFEDVLQLLMAFQLMEVGAAPVRIVRTLGASWPAVRRALRTAWIYCTVDGAAAPDLLVLVPRALVDLGEDERDGGGAIDPLMGSDRDRLVEWMSPRVKEIVVGDEHRLDDDDRLCARLVIDPLRVVRLVRAVLPRVSAVPVEDVDRGFRALSAE